MLVRSCCVVVAHALGASATAQEIVWTVQGSPPPNRIVFAGPIRLLGDFDHDGHDDLLVLGAGSTGLAQLWVLSGKDGATLRVSPPPASSRYGIQALSDAGDMDGDGSPDYVVGLTDLTFTTTNWVEARRGLDDRVLWRVSGSWDDLFAFSVLGNLDVDGDGKPDVLVGAERENGFAGAVHVFNNRGALLYRATVPGSSWLGRFLARVGDLDRDGADDYAVSAVVPPTAAAIVFSGRTGREIVRGLGDRTAAFNGPLVGCGDLDGDGLPDFAAGTGGSFGQRGYVRAFSGRTGDVLYEWTSPSPSQYGNGFGDCLAAGQDLDLDGVPDVMTCTTEPLPSVQTFATYVYSGRDGAPIHRIAGIPCPNGTLASPVMLPPQPGHPFPLFAGVMSLSDPRGNPMHCVQMRRGSPAGVRPLGVACAGALAAPPQIGLRHLLGPRPVPGETPYTYVQEPQGVRIHLSRCRSGSVAVLVLGFSSTSAHGVPLPWSLGGIGFPGCSLFVSPDLLVPVAVGSAGGTSDYAFVDLPVPLAASGTGVRLHGQWLCSGGGAVLCGGASAALSWVH